jgi:hypothetical protein
VDSKDAEILKERGGRRFKQKNWKSIHQGDLG